VASDHPLEPIAIVGLGCRFPGAPDPVRFWQMLRDSREAVSMVPPDRWDADAFYDPDPAAPGKMNSRYGNFLDQVDQFDSAFFGMAPREADLMDPQQRLLLEVAREALEDAGILPASLARSATGVFVGLASANYGSLLFSDPAEVGAFTNSGAANCIAANRISYTWDLAGPSISVDTACSSSLVAVHLACQSLWTGESTLALAGGANIILVPGPSISIAKARTMSPDGRCRVFDANANGFGRGEGAGMVVLKPLSRAQADGDSIYAVIRATATQQNGRTNGLMAPSRWAQEAVLRTAWQRAGISPAQVQYIEAHSSATPIGDAMELNALASVLNEGRAAGEKCSIGSVKTNIGHLEAAAGIAGLIKVALMLRHQTIVPSLHFQSPNTHVPFAELPLRVQQATEPWPSEDAVAGVSASGYGGVNAHVVLETVPAPTEPRSVPMPHLLTLSAHQGDALHALARKFLDFIDENEPDEAIANLCYTLSARRTHFAHRLAATGNTAAALRRELQAFIDRKSSPCLFDGIVKSSRAAKGGTSTAASAAELAEDFVAGRSIDWQTWYGGGRISRLGLPTYPFQRRRHWLATAEAATPSVTPNVAAEPVQAQSTTEETLLALWRRILGVHDIGPHANFFELGGGSLMAAELLTEIERIYSLTVTAGVLLENSTIAQLARVIESDQSSVRAPLLVQMRAGGHRSPVIIVAPDHLYHYVDLLKNIDPNHPVYGLQPPYPDGFRQAGITIEQMAEVYLPELKSVCPEGVCHITGYCAGGVVAYELAQRFVADGGRVGLLALLDTPCPMPRKNRPTGRLRYIKLRLLTHWLRLKQLSLREMIKYVSIRARLAMAIVLRPLRGEPRRPLHAAAINSIANRAAIYRYGTLPYSGVIDLFHSQERDPMWTLDTRLMWRDVSSDVRVHKFAGRHGMFLRPPVVADLGARLNDVLADAENRLRQKSEALTNDDVASHSLVSSPA
jgi:3-oxoacyl-(acyl-carrier-protein) synthase/thioesterase domain-containing protein